MNERILVLDYGSNSLRWLLADHLPGAPLSPLEVGGESLRLGRAVPGPSGRPALDPAAVERALAATRRAVDFGSRNGFHRIKAVATHFARRLDGVEEFARRLADDFGLRLYVLTGEQEAYLTRRGVEEGLAGLGLEGRGALCVDIGGGSTELSWWEDRRLAVRSLELGALDLTDRFLPDDPPSVQRLLELRVAVRSVLSEDLNDKTAEVGFAGTVAASGGSATTLAALDLGLDDYRPLLIQGHRLSARRLDALIDELAALPLERRRERLRPDPPRAEIIIAGAVALHELLGVVGAGEMLVSDYDLKHGAAVTELEELG